MDGWWGWVAACAACAAGVGILALKRYTSGAVFKGNVDLSGKTVVITGANCGIGRAAAAELCKRGARVILACRNVTKGERAASQINKATAGKGVAVVRELNLASLSSVREFANVLLQEESHIDILVNNAGVFQCPYDVTEDGFEMQMGVNYLGHFLLTSLLTSRLTSSAPSRVIVVSSGLSKRGRVNVGQLSVTRENYDKKAGYNDSKLACNYFARELARQLQGTGVDVHCVCPGMVDSDLGRHVKLSWSLWMKVLIAPVWWLLVKNCDYGCQSLVYCAAAEHLAGTSGGFYKNCVAAPWPEGASVNEKVERELWDQSAKLVGL